MGEFNHNYFPANVKRAEKGEYYVANLLNNNYADFDLDVHDLNQDYRFDIRGTLAGNPVHIEVKEDRRCNSTGNVVVEYKSKGRLSGISTTKADYWVFRLHRFNNIRHFIISIGNLKKVVKEEKYFMKKYMEDTDSNNNTYLFKYDKLIADCYALD